MAWKSHIVVYLALQALGVSADAACPTFSSASKSTVSCDPSCLRSTNKAEDQVFGTEHYTESSPVCLAALHDGVVGNQGGQVHFTRGDVTEIIGTTNNRIVSNSADPEVAFRFVREEDPEIVKEQDLAGDMVVVHNSYHDKKLQLSCLSYNSGIKLARWDYKTLGGKITRFRSQMIKPAGNCVFPFTYSGKRYWDCTSVGSSTWWCGTSQNARYWTDCSKEEGPRGLHRENKRSDNARAFRCLGSSPATDVLTVIQTADQLYKTETSTIRASRGDHLQIEMQKASGQENDVFFRRLPDSFKYKSGNFPDVSLPLTLSPVKPGDSGIYIVGRDGTKKWSDVTKTTVEHLGAYFHIMVRECEAGRFGWRCESWCPDCQNGGVCHPRTGTCLCPPGFTGPTCRRPCPKGRFGSRCQLRCIRDTLGFAPPEEGSCKHLTFCLPDPFGCSCAPGFHGPTCSDECASGRYGAGCSLSCKAFCVDGECDSSSGGCSNGCQQPVMCDSANRTLDLPRLRDPPTVTDISNSSAEVRFVPWTPEAGDGSEDFAVTDYEVQFRREDESYWTSVGLVQAVSPHATLERLSSGYSYFVRVLVHTLSGVLDGSSNQRVRTVHFVTQCSDIEVNSINATNITSSSVLLSWPPPPVPIHDRCNASVTVILEAVPSGGSPVTGNTRGNSLTLEGLSPDTTYGVSVKMDSSSMRKPRFNIFNNIFRTPVLPPSRPRVEVAAREVGQIAASWTLPPGSTAAQTYRLTYQLLKHEACQSGAREEAAVHTSAAPSLLLVDLESFATYRVCVTAQNEGGESPQGCETVTTLPSAPGIGIGTTSCTQYRPLYCTAYVSGGCEEFNGPNIRSNLRLKTFLHCENQYLESNVSGVVYSGSGYTSFSGKDDLIPGQLYDAYYAVSNDAGSGRETQTTFNTTPTRPPAVRDLEAVSMSSTEVRLLWNDPCPPNGQITHLSYKRISEHLYTDIEAVSCTERSHFDRCIDIQDLTPNRNYTFRVAAKTRGVRGDFKDISVVTKETKPGPPFKLSYDADESALNVSLHLPEKPGGVLLRCSVELEGREASCVLPLLPTEQGPLVCELNGFEQGRRYTAKGYCCNSVGCGPALETAMATLPLPPTFSGALTVLEKSDTNITIALPSVQNAGDGDSSLIVMVQHIPKDGEVAKVNFTETYLKSAKTGSRSLRRRRQSEGACINPDDIYVAGVSRGEERRFVIGKGGSEGDYDNCPLTPGDSYRIAIVAEVDLEGRKSYAETSLGYPVVAARDETSVLAIVLSLLVIVMFLILLVFFVIHRRVVGKRIVPSGRQDDSTMRLEEIASNGRDVIAVQTPETLIPVSSPSFHNSIYDDVGPTSPQENIYENIGESASFRVQRDDLESYLNKAIGNLETAEAFKKIPTNVGKSMAYAQQIQLKRKNRFRDNLPYDETRVKLSVLNDDSFTDYINASYVYGFGGSMRYIACQGPKDANVNTIGDFWRMIIEQGMGLIIMVANFVEGGKVKVGEYFKPGTTLEFEGFVVTVVTSEQHPHYVVSTIQVWKDDSCHTVTHYHYTKWPDHGVPNEARTLAVMLRNFINTHREGGVVVHCSAGIGRTGTVMQVLLMQEVLTVTGSVDPFEVLQRLRDCRARLVENQAQFNLGLEVFDEILFGSKTAFESATMPPTLLESEAQYKRAKSLPHGLTFRIASQPKFVHLNRSKDVLPADSRSIFLSSGDGRAESQYINAVRLDGLDKPNSLIATEHPLPEAELKFWHLVVEKNCASVVLLNAFGEGEQADYPSLVQAGYFTVGPYTIQTQQTLEYETLIQYSLSITTDKDKEHKANLYQVRHWPRDCEVPSTPEVLTTLADLLLSVPAREGPVLLSCADGVTACGLMAGVILCVERLQLFQEVDIYRTAVRLMRMRPQFLVSQAQFDLLYEAAVNYKENFDTYANF